MLLQNSCWLHGSQEGHISSREPGSFEPSYRSQGEKQRTKSGIWAWGLTPEGLQQGCTSSGRAEGPTGCASSRALGRAEPPPWGAQLYKILPARQRGFLARDRAAPRAVPCPVPPARRGWGHGGTVLPVPSTAATSPPGPVALGNAGDTLWHLPCLGAAFGDPSSSGHV